MAKTAVTARNQYTPSPLPLHFQLGDYNTHSTCQGPCAMRWLGEPRMLPSNVVWNDGNGGSLTVGSGSPRRLLSLRCFRVHTGNVKFHRLDRSWWDRRGHSWLIHRLRPLSVVARHQLAPAYAQLLRVLWVVANTYRPCSHRQLAVPRRSLSALQSTDRHRQSSCGIHICFDRSIVGVLVDR